MGLGSLIGRFQLRRTESRLRQLAEIGEHLITGPKTSISLAGASPDQIRIGHHVTLLEAELRCYARGRIEIADYCWFSLRLQLISASSISIGPYCIVARDVYISDTNEHPTDPLIRREQTLAHLREGIPPDRYAASTSPIVIGADVWIGERACILKGVTIGPGSVVAANSVVVADVPAGSIVAGNPGRIVKRLS